MCPANSSPAPISQFKHAAIVTADPAGVGPCGIAVRLTAPLTDPDVSRIRYPDWTYEGPMFSTAMADDLALFVAKRIPAGASVLLAVDGTAYNSLTVARHLGRAIGGLEMLLLNLNLAKPENTQYVAGATWRRWVWPGGDRPMPKGRDALKAGAQAEVAQRYREHVGHDLAEAVLLNDYVTFRMGARWRG